MCGQIIRIITLLFLLTYCNAIRVHSGPLPFMFKALAPVKQQEVSKKYYIISKENENKEPIVLDCDYNALTYESSLLVKWFKNNNLIYQWIKGREPTLYPSMNGIIEPKYEHSIVPNYRYRAIKFPKPTKELSGNYSCLVTTDTATHFKIELNIIDISIAEFKFYHDTFKNETRLTCGVETIYPQPVILLTSDNDDLTITTISEEHVLDYNDYFNATTVASIPKLDLDNVITCTVTFEGIDFNISKTLASSAANIIQSTIIILLTLFIIFVNKI